ncbi:ZINC KNUCKLE CX2CX4HX4C-RELATED [Salix viminalis]|uniref:ZINC KNUCKLE CX2CX4HX4C-RELATED n=1 Tax=Salix viminalis TaxID=40686 RepID=A0A9Q0TND3_SALVM|nr:ZINC KNUCKLE CX2CX4HX4C-RELATED [Salix viminalis]
MATWADKVRVTDATTRHTLEPVPQKPAGSCLKIPAEILQHNLEHWTRCMIGFFTGCRLPYHAVNLIAKKAWSSYGLEQVLTMKDAFQFDRRKITKLSVWIRMRGMPLPLWTKKGLSLAASMVGKPLSCDELTISGKRLDYARLCIELDASLPFIHQFEVDSPLTKDPLRVEGGPRNQPETHPECNTVIIDHIPTAEPVQSQVHEENGLENMKHGRPNKAQEEGSKREGPVKEGQCCVSQDSSTATSKNPNPKEVDGDNELSSVQADSQDPSRDDSNAWSPPVVRKKKGGRKWREAKGF